jgi:hypothetical protein
LPAIQPLFTLKAFFEEKLKLGGIACRGLLSPLFDVWAMDSIAMGVQALLTK